MFMDHAPSGQKRTGPNGWRSVGALAGDLKSPAGAEYVNEGQRPSFMVSECYRPLIRIIKEWIGLEGGTTIGQNGKWPLTERYFLVFPR